MNVIIVLLCISKAELYVYVHTETIVVRVSRSAMHPEVLMPIQRLVEISALHIARGMRGISLPS